MESINKFSVPTEIYDLKVGDYVVIGSHFENIEKENHVNDRDILPRMSKVLINSFGSLNTLQERGVHVLEKNSIGRVTKVTFKNQRVLSVNVTVGHASIFLNGRILYSSSAFKISATTELDKFIVLDFPKNYRPLLNCTIPQRFSIVQYFSPTWIRRTTSWIYPINSFFDKETFSDSVISSAAQIKVIEEFRESYRIKEIKFENYKLTGLLK